MGLLSIVALLSGLASATVPPAAELSAAVRGILSSDVFRIGCERLSGLPQLCDTFAAAAAASASKHSLDVQPIKGLLDEETCLLRAVRDDAYKHVLDSIGLAHPHSSDPSQSETADLVAAARHVASFGASGALDIHDHRMEITSIISSVAADLQGLSAEIHALMPASVRMVAGSTNVAFIAAMARSMGWPDTTIHECFVSGFPIVGLIPASGVPSYREVDRDPSFPDIQSLSNAEWNTKLAHRVKTEFSEGKWLDAGVLWTETIKEVGKGVCLGPFTAAQLNHKYGEDGWRSMLRFGVHQTRSDGSDKCRPCDDAASSMHNECTSLAETITCEKADWPARVAALFFELLGSDGGWSMRGGTEDIELAYRQCPCRTPQYTAFVAVEPVSGEAFFFILPGLNFGLVAAVNQFNRLPELVVAFLRRRCGVVTTHYFDDYCVCEPSYAAGTGQDLLKSVHRLIGMPLSVEKHVSMRQQFVFLGVLVDFSHFVVRRVVYLRPKPGRVASITAAIAAILAAGFISHGAAASLRGKLQFLLCTVGHGARLARSVLGALARVRRCSRNVPMQEDLRSTLRFLHACIGEFPDRAINFSHRAAQAVRLPVVVWSDAMWNESVKDGEGNLTTPGVGGLGFVVWFPPGHPGAAGRPGGRFIYAASKASDSSFDFFTRDHHLIQQMELIAAAAVYTSFPASYFSGWGVLHFIDNVGALSGFIKGVSRAIDSLAIIRSFLVANMAIKADVWFSYVASKANVSDLPSRGELDTMAGLLRRISPSFDLKKDGVDLVTPVCYPDAAAVWAAVVAQLGIPAPAPVASARTRGRKRGR